MADVLAELANDTSTFEVVSDEKSSRPATSSS